MNPTLIKEFYAVSFSSRKSICSIKLVRVSHGEIQDVVVDIRKKSKLLGKHISIKLSKQNGRQLFVPKGFAHGFLVLSKYAIVNYKVDNYYSKES